VAADVPKVVAEAKVEQPQPGKPAEQKARVYANSSAPLCANCGNMTQEPVVATYARRADQRRGVAKPQPQTNGTLQLSVPFLLLCFVDNLSQKGPDRGQLQD